MIKRSFLLFPFSLLYGFVVTVRNILYDKGLLNSVSYNIPVICVGNLTVGGTGKTPHIEYIVRHLQGRYKVAVLSRGYKRKTRGFLVANINSKVDDIGDEPYQISRKYPDIVVAVDANRNRGIERILERYPDTEVVLMDDGFQHRSVLPGLSIVLSDYGRPVVEDSLLPYGNLRESKKSLRRANLMVVAKSPNNRNFSVNGTIEDKLRKYYEGEIVYTSLKYKEFVPLFANNQNSMAPRLRKEEGKDTGIILITGIANPRPLIEYLRTMFREIVHLEFGDHHRFTGRDISKICGAFEKLKTTRKYILTTENDAVRLREFTKITRPIQHFVFYIGIEIEFFLEGKAKFDQIIDAYVGQNSRDSSIS